MPARDRPSYYCSPTSITRVSFTLWKRERVAHGVAVDRCVFEYVYSHRRSLQSVKRFSCRNTFREGKRACVRWRSARTSRCIRTRCARGTRGGSRRCFRSFGFGFLCGVLRLAFFYEVERKIKGMRMESEGGGEGGRCVQGEHHVCVYCAQTLCENEQILDGLRTHSRLLSTSTIPANNKLGITKLYYPPTPSQHHHHPDTKISETYHKERRHREQPAKRKHHQPQEREGGRERKAYAVMIPVLTV